MTNDLPQVRYLMSSWLRPDIRSTGGLPRRRRSIGPMIALATLLISGVGAWIARGHGSETASAAAIIVAPPPPVNGVRLLADGDYAPAIERLFREATTSIDVTMFSCVLPVAPSAHHPVRRLLDILAERAKAGVHVRVVLDHGVLAGRSKEGEEPPSDNGARYLKAAGIDVRWDEDKRTTHTKSFTVDGRWCVVGSTNWSASALTRNREQSLLLDSPELANDLTKRFEALWQASHAVE